MILFRELPIGTKFHIAADWFKTACVKESDHSSFGERYGTYRQVSQHGQPSLPYVIELDCEVKAIQFPWQVVSMPESFIVYVPEGLGKA